MERESQGEKDKPTDLCCKVKYDTDKTNQQQEEGSKFKKGA